VECLKDHGYTKVDVQANFNKTCEEILYTGNRKLCKEKFIKSTLKYFFDTMETTLGVDIYLIPNSPF